MDLANPGAIYPHCLPAEGGYKVTVDVIDGPQFAALDGTENRRAVQPAIMALTMK